MSTSRNVVPLTTRKAPPANEEPVELTSWRHEHEVRALRDTLAIYRRLATTLAAENTRLHKQLADRSVRATRSDGDTIRRSRGCRA